jgi:hypothetical protein
VKETKASGPISLPDSGKVVGSSSGTGVGHGKGSSGETQKIDSSRQ